MRGGDDLDRRSFGGNRGHSYYSSQKSGTSRYPVNPLAKNARLPRTFARPKI